MVSARTDPRSEIRPDRTCFDPHSKDQKSKLISSKSCICTHTTPTHTTPTHTDPVPSKKVEESDSPQSLFWIVVLIISYILMQAYVNKKR